MDRITWPREKPKPIEQYSDDPLWRYSRRSILSLIGFKPLGLFCLGEFYQG
jgi:hypothetical protein